MIAIFRLSFVLACAFAVFPSTAAAETSATCTGFIEALPATISTQGIWCLKKDLATGMSSGNAITINTNNVTLDCNGFKIGGLAAGAGTNAVGIGSMQRDNVTIRNCNVRGFWLGINVAYNAGGTAAPTGGLIMNNRLDGNTRMGIIVSSDGAVIRGNTVVDTGGNAGGENPIAIWTDFGVDVIDNLIDGVFPTGDSPAQTYGIISWNNQGGVISRNRIRNVIANNHANGIVLTSDAIGVAVADNVIYLPDQNASAIYCFGDASDAVAVRNLLTGPAAWMIGCRDGGGNVLPIL